MHPGSAPALPPSVATRLRTVILNGELAPGTFLREVEWAKRLNVSRNTLREAMRDLIAQGLVEHRPHHGVAIRSLMEIEIREIYAIRMTLELRGVCHSAYASVDQMNTLIAQVGAMQEAARIDDWNEVATASLRFHRQIVSFIGSPRLNDLFTSVATQARLAFSYAPDMRRFQEPWIARDSQTTRRQSRPNLQEKPNETPGHQSGAAGCAGPQSGRSGDLLPGRDIATARPARLSRPSRRS
ncbi:GntR family transcriptional regulator [Paracoccus sp. MBLB3053]|uniref:GntR family transcriptional regulator n=1 Tax=Paracoccus aurantius TaxID=3073814 RepID=A0ABU2HVZ6_9RHOB|nr:GntR family transcriptional regulator [Paracoccus sp. MBLB3053]MDS9469206.1 GntR family transcriptional regulator [Paracoccus sp. MBLB3053]